LDVGFAFMLRILGQLLGAYANPSVLSLSHD